jgi:hypothetical protein
MEPRLADKIAMDILLKQPLKMRTRSFDKSGSPQPINIQIAIPRSATILGWLPIYDPKRKYSFVPST